MIKVERIGHNLNKVQIEGCPDTLKIELRVLLNAIIDSPVLEDVFLDIVSEIANHHIEELEKVIRHD